MFRKPKKHTDKCKLCVVGKNIEKKLKKLEKKLKTSQTNEERNSIKKMIQRAQTLLSNYQTHKSDSKHQQTKLKEKIKSLRRNSAIFMMDFKMNIKINESATHELGHDFYKNTQRSCFGVVMYYMSPHGKVKHHYFDFFSKYTAHTSYSAICGLKQVFAQKWVKKLDLKSVTFMMDNGGTFRTWEMFAYFFQLRKKFDEVFVNFFVEYHGKSDCDRRFAQITAMYTNFVNNSNNPPIRTTKDLVNCIATQSQKSTISSSQHYYRVCPPKTVKMLDIKGFKFNYYSFEFGKKSVTAYYLTGANSKATVWNNVSLCENQRKTVNVVNNLPETEEEAEKCLERLTVFYENREKAHRPSSQENTNSHKRKSESFDHQHIVSDEEYQPNKRRKNDIDNGNRPVTRKISQSQQLPIQLPLSHQLPSQLLLSQQSFSQLPPSRKRKASFNETSPKKIKDNSHELFSSFYKHYESIQEQTLMQVVETDKKYFISGELSATISKQHFSGQYHLSGQQCSLIQLVKTSELLAFREYDRAVVPKELGANAENEIEKKCGSIASIGLKHPLLLSYCHASKGAILTEGNHRLAWFDKHNIDYVPIQIVAFSGSGLNTNNNDENLSDYEESQDGSELMDIDEYTWPKVIEHPSKFNKNIVASDLGFSVLQPNKYKHPYFSTALEESVQLDVDPVSWYDQEIVSGTDEDMVCYNDLINS